MEEVADADILTAAAAGNDEGALTLGPRLFNTASPASYPRVFAVAHLNNTANPGSLIQVSESINTATGTRSMLGERAGSKQHLLPQSKSMRSRWFQKATVHKAV